MLPSEKRPPYGIIKRGLKVSPSKERSSRRRRRVRRNTDFSGKAVSCLGLGRDDPEGCYDYAAAELAIPSSCDLYFLRMTGGGIVTKTLARLVEQKGRFFHDDVMQVLSFAPPFFSSLFFLAPADDWSLSLTSPPRASHRAR